MSFKIDKKIKKALQTLADQEYRSLSDYVVMVLKKHLDEKNIEWHKEGVKKSKK
ncbi:MAG: hypothetical protein JSW04_08335 [Desulfobacterales bacterium]|nr:MAG: hypothetical protein JSW04_08335 [Desulfobacterales bacterium]